MPSLLPHVSTPCSDASARGARLHRCVTALYPLHRCITGEGLRATLQVIGQKIPLSICELPSGTPVLDWTVPQEWRVGEAWIETAEGTRVLDLRDSPLHVVQYSTAVRERMTLRELRSHLHTLPEQPDLIPYRTSYYAPAWGFCLPQRVLDALAAQGGEDQELEVCIEAEHFDGAMTYGECVLPGETDEEVLLSSHVCHPGLANDNCSAVTIAVALASELLERPHRHYTYRFLFAPGTIGTIAWLAQNRAGLDRIRHGLVLANLGDAGGFTYQMTRRGTLSDTPRPIDRAVVHALEADGVDVRPFAPVGYDERQFNSPGFDLPIGRLTRTPHGEYPEYHTSGDDPSLVSPEALEGSLGALRRIVDVLEGNAVYRSTQPYGEPQLGRRGLYRTTGGAAHTPEAQQALLWTLNLADGAHSLLDVAEQAGLPFAAIRTAADRLLDADLLEPLDC